MSQVGQTERVHLDNKNVLQCKPDEPALFHTDISHKNLANLKEVFLAENVTFFIYDACVDIEQTVPTGCN